MYIGNRFIPMATITLMAIVWLGFLVCIGLLLSARFMKANFQKRFAADVGARRRRNRRNGQ